MQLFIQHYSSDVHYSSMEQEQMFTTVAELKQNKKCFANFLRHGGSPGICSKAICSKNPSEYLFILLILNSFSFNFDRRSEWEWNDIQKRWKINITS